MFFFGLIVTAAFAPPPPDLARRDALTRYGVARMQTRGNQLASAATQLEKATKLDPSAVAPKRDLVRLYADLGRDAAALRVAGELIENKAADVGTLRVLARIHSQALNHKLAAQYLAEALLLTELVKRPATKLAVIRDMARACQADKNWDVAAKCWQDAAAFVEENFAKLKADSYDAIELHRERALAFENQGLMLLECKKPGEAATAFLAAAAIFKDATQANDANSAARLHWHLALAHQAAGDPAEANRSLNRFLILKPRNIAPYLKLVELMKSNQQESQIVERLNSLAVTHANIDAIGWVKSSELAKSDFIAAHRQFQEQMLRTTDDAFFQLMVKTYQDRIQPRALLEIGELLFPAPSPDEKKKVPDVTPEQSDRQQAFANALNAHRGVALPLLRAANDGRSFSSELWELLAWIADRNDLPADLERCLVAANRAARNTVSLTAFSRLVEHYRRARQWQKLIAIIEDTQGLNITWRTESHAVALLELGHGDEAFELVNKTAALPIFDRKQQLASLHGYLGQYDDMLKTINETMKDINDDTTARRIRLLRAEAYLGLNRIDDMEAELRGLLEHDPDDVVVLNNLGYNLADRNRKLPEAERLIRRAIEIDSLNRAKAGDAFAVSGVYLDSLGWVLFRRGDLKAARLQLQKATELPDGRADAIVWDHLGDVCFRLEDKAAAKVAWTNAASRYVNDHRGKLLGRADEVTRKLKLCE